ncbi:MAG: GNAT family N-acetyltransferase [Fulvivirga sp.]|uniref:GNAT family N-acetyltransferase n=1 Tax=Fulvivirga sp. TaxID=1931237 RepID=UPI0032EC62EF
MTLVVKDISSEEEMKQAFEIRRIVFVEGQNVPFEEELDQYEDESHHLLALYNNEPAGTCRWRFTKDGIKLERFAVMEAYRGNKIGSALVETTLNKIKAHPDYNGQMLYLNSQLAAVFLYKKFEFKEVGEEFLECDIRHQKMIKYL